MAQHHSHLVLTREYHFLIYCQQEQYWLLEIRQVVSHLAHAMNAGQCQ